MQWGTYYSFHLDKSNIVAASAVSVVGSKVVLLNLLGALLWG